MQEASGPQKSWILVKSEQEGAWEVFLCPLQADTALQGTLGQGGALQAPQGLDGPVQKAPSSRLGPGQEVICSIQLPVWLTLGLSEKLRQGCLPRHLIHAY